jgi:hypothetical protein
MNKNLIEKFQIIFKNYENLVLDVELDIEKNISEKVIKKSKK